MNARYATGMLAFSAGLMIAGSSHAQPNCNNSYCVYDHADAQGNKTQQSVSLGVPLQTNMVEHRFPTSHSPNTPYSLTYDKNGFQVNALFLFTSTDCSGKAYAYYVGSSQVEPNWAQFDGVNAWTTDDSNIQTITVNSYSWFWDWNAKKVSDQCLRYTIQSYPASTPVLLGPLNSSPPFTIR